VEKIPLLAISFFFGLQSIADQKKFGSLDADNIAYSPIERIALGSYAFITYLWKAIVPVKLCNFYPYPLRKADALESSYYIYAGLAAIILAAVFFVWRRNKTVMFGTLFFLVNIVLLLQFLPVGGAIVADRYSYIPYLGLFFIIGQVVAGLMEKEGAKNLGYGALGIVLAWSGWLGYEARERCRAWYDTTTLWRDEIEKEPHDAPNAWNNLGFNYFNKYNDAITPADRKLYFDSSELCLKQAIYLQPTFVNPYISLGELQRSAGIADPRQQLQYFAVAKQYYYKALTLKSFDEAPNAYLGLAIIYAITRRFDSSEFCFRKAVTGQQQFPEAHSNFGNFFDMTGRPDSALAHYAISIQQNPDIFPPHLNRGRLLFRMGRYDEALKDLDICLALAPNNGEVYYYHGVAMKQKGNNDQAQRDFQKAASLGYKP
jgi:Flp pilus assembly protein TadD